MKDRFQQLDIWLTVHPIELMTGTKTFRADAFGALIFHARILRQMFSLPDRHPTPHGTLNGHIGGNAGPQELSAWTEEVRDIGAVMRATSACGLGMAAPFVTDSLLKFFPQAVEQHLGELPHTTQS